MKDKFLSGLAKINQIYLRNKGSIFYRINLFFISISILVVTIIYAVNSDKIERFRGDSIWPFSILKIADKQLSLYYKPNQAREVSFLDEQTKNDQYHIILIDKTVIEQNNETLHRDVKAEINQLIARNTGIPTPKITNLSLSEKITLYYLSKIVSSYDKEKVYGLIYQGKEIINDNDFIPCSSGNLIETTHDVFSQPNNGVTAGIRTNFKEIIDEIITKVEIIIAEKGTSSPKIVVSILSDFDHDILSGENVQTNQFSEVAFSEVLTSLDKMSNYNYIHQVNLVKFPERLRSGNVQINSVGELVHQFGKANRNTFLYTFDVNNFLEKNQEKQDNFRKLDFLVAPVNDNSTNYIELYYPFNHRVSNSAALGQINLKHINMDRFVLALDYSFSRQDDDFYLYYLSEKNKPSAPDSLNLTKKLRPNNVVLVNEGYLSTLVPSVYQQKDLFDLHFIVYPLKRNKEKNKNYLPSKEKIAIRLIERLTKNDALLLGIFSLTFIIGILSYVIIFVLSFFKSFSFNSVVAVFILQTILMLYLTHYLFGSFFFVVKDSYTSIFLLVFPVIPLFSIFFWSANKTLSN